MSNRKTTRNCQKYQRSEYLRDSNITGEEPPCRRPAPNIKALLLQGPRAQLLDLRRVSARRRKSHGGVNFRASTRRTDNLKISQHRSHPFTHSDQANSARLTGRIKSAAVVADQQARLVCGMTYHDANARRATVPHDVVQSFLRHPE